MGMLTLLAACNGPAVDRPAPVDLDGDGFVAGEDCDDTRASVHPGAGDLAGDGIDQDCDGVDPFPRDTVEGASPDEGFGSRVLVTADRIVYAAPFHAAGGLAAGRVSSSDGLTLSGTDGAFLGAGLAALSDGTVLVGAPGVGRVTTLDGAVLLEHDGAGGVLAARGSAWVASTAIGIVDATGRTDWDRHPDALVIDADGEVWAGFARGDIAIRVGDRSVARASPTDEAGYALLFVDTDADGDEELVVGAPGAGVVYILDPDALPASLADATPLGPGAGRFGAALAGGPDGALYVGAPMAGPDVAGAVWRVRDSVAEPWLVGDTSGDQLGAALSFGRATLVVGAPGAAGTPGSVRAVAP